ncbi:MAG: HD domain-containing protein [Coriobacteriia bacterium]|nr:HD domain-containing protein [Coriobacteriia bacterium]
MKKDYVNELAEGMKVDAPFALRAKEVRSSRAGDPYLSLELADRTGQLPAVLFRPSGGALAVPVGSVVHIQGTVTVYRGMKRISVVALTPAENHDPADMIAAGVSSIPELQAQFRALVRSVSDQGMSRVLRAVFGEARYFGLFCRCPGSQSHHHAYLGGLLEHSVAVARLCVSLSEQYPAVDRDLLVTAALLHDVGKCDELSFETAIEYTDEGRLVGHVVLGMRRLHSAVERVGRQLPAERAMQLEHAVLSHHGELEWGSPKKPSTLEALLLHHADNLDAKAAGFSSLLRGAARADEVWTDAANLFRRPLYAPKAVEDDRPHAVDEDAQYSRLTA